MTVKMEGEDGRGGYKAMIESDKNNVSFEAYYKAQKLMDESEFETFLEACKKSLPTTFRITSHGSKVDLIKEQLKTEFIPNLEKISESQAVSAVPKVIPWYPKELAYQLETDRPMIRKEPSLAAFHRWLVEASQNGDITRQEAVSMIPPMLLDIDPEHMVLDVCAAPGSKTSQLLEALHEKCLPEEFPSGAIIANDLNKDRAYMLFHQVKRFDSPALMVCNHDGSFFPNLYLDKDTKDPLEFDRILADVPCTGDGTTRKNIDIWKTWSPRAGLGLHPIQIRILERCLSMLKTGGRIVYSTCSYNPVENEAVIAHILTKYAGKIKLVDVSDRLVGLKYRKGLSEWRLIDKNGKESLHPDRLPEGHENDPNFRVPLTAYCRPEYAELGLDRCIRVLPHDQNSGGFFIVLLEKVSEIGTEKSRGHRKRPNEAVVSEEQPAEELSPAQPPAKKGRFNNADEEPFSFLSMDSPIVTKLVDFFGFNTEILNRGAFLVRSSKDCPKNLYFVSEPIAKLVNGGNEKLRVINTGIKCFELYDNKNQGFECPYRQTMDALATMLPLMSKRIYDASAADLLALLSSEDSISNEALSEGLASQLQDISTGSCVFVHTEENGSIIAIPVWSTKNISKAFVARPDRPKLMSHLQKLI